ncbi:MAG: anaerobic ribonucleoside-triphosphate reductase activating protein [Oscillospiraceae bacterium]|nr:anaerobic ribonucleoside-triphosphate reductase activating protein [Oscillospiraceae bacterium]
MRIAGLVQESIVDGPGFRFVVFAQGCHRRCEGCHNPDSFDLDGGVEVSVEYLITAMLANPLTDGLTLSGGEPFLQAADCAVIARAAKENGLNVWTYTGYTFEELLREGKIANEFNELLELSDVLIDGAFDISQRSLMLKYRGSKNQRIIDVGNSLVNNVVVELYS